MKITKKKFVIIGLSNAKFGDFLVTHWIRSLLNNIDRRIIEVVILDYGLTNSQKEALTKNKVKIISCKENGHIVNIRYRDILRFLNKNHYEQVMTCDSGDIIFQGNIMSLFDKNKDKFRAVCEDFPPAAMEFTMMRKPFLPSAEKDIGNVLKGKNMINGGLVIGPYDKFKKLCKNMQNLIVNKQIFGPDQVILNYTLYKEGFKRLESKYNYVLTTAKDGFKIKKGIFIGSDGKPITVVHNAGAQNIFRPVDNFGYGPSYNKIKLPNYILMRAFCKVSNLFIPIIRFFTKY